MNPPTIDYLLDHVAAVLHRQADQVLQERLGIGMAQYKILMLLRTRPATSQRQLADSLGQTEASVSRQVKLLQQKALLTTAINPAERRRHMTRPTKKGLRITQAAAEVLAAYHEPMFERLSDKQKEQLETLLGALHDYTCATGRPMACDHSVDTAQT